MMKWDEMQLRFNLVGFDGLDLEGKVISPEEARMISEVARQALENGSRMSADERGVIQSKEWWGDYLRLIEMGWPWRVACYIAWSASPKLTRWPETLEKLAREVLGLAGPRVIYTWRRKHPSIDTVTAMMQAAPLWEHRREIFEAMVKVAAEPDYKGFNDRKLALEMMGDYVPRSASMVGLKATGALSELSDAELERLVGGEELLTEKTDEHGLDIKEGGDV
jgi:hypothetical protein